MDKHYAGHNADKCARRGERVRALHAGEPAQGRRRRLDRRGEVDLSEVQGVSAEGRRKPTISSSPRSRPCRSGPTSSRRRPTASSRSATASPVRSTCSTGTGSNDDTIFDPNHPESLVYKVDRGDGDQDARGGDVHPAEEVHAREPAPDRQPARAVPLPRQPVLHGGHARIGPQVRGLTNAQGNCTSAFAPDKFNPNIQVHVWIRPNECGPFAALSGVGAGQIEGRGARHATTTTPSSSSRKPALTRDVAPRR